MVRKSQEKLSQAALRRSIVSKHTGESSVTQRLWQTLTESFTGSGIVAKSVTVSVFVLSEGTLKRIRGDVPQEAPDNMLK